ncbi:uncharacterized protein isoform X2 [Rhodnius prolixus]|uniref:uncharacterized protein isoform X2 n=1 Tax=Rhodnius prolixus TaxID=13249 RepID=UPI003D18DFCC
MDQDQQIYDTAKSEFWYLLQIGALFPNFQPKWKRYSILQVVIYLIIVVYHVGLLGKTVILSLENHDIATFAMTFHFFTIGILVIILLSNINNHRESIIIFLKNIQAKYYKYGDSSTKVLQDKLNLESRKFKIILLTAIPAYFSLIALAWIVVVPIVDQYQGGKKTYENGIYMECPVPLWFPYLIDNNFKYLLSMASEASVAFIFSVTIAAANVGVIFFSMDLITQLKILNHSIKLIEKRARILYEENGGKFKENALNSDKENAVYSKIINYCIQQNVEHHKVITESFNALLTIAKWPLMLVFIVAALIVALSLYISVSSNYLFHQFYNINWIHWDKTCKSSIMIARERYKKPLVMSGGGMIAANLSTYSDIMSSAYSYFQLLYALESEK